MANTTSIEWTDATWNPIRGCSRVSEGCRHCYAERVAARFSGKGMAYEGLAQLVTIGAGTPQEHTEPHWTGEVRLIEEHLMDPLSWREPKLVFVNSMSDMFHEKLDMLPIARCYAVMALAWWHTFQVLTKRSKRMQGILSHPSFPGFVAEYMEKMQGGSQRNAPATIPAGITHGLKTHELMKELTAGRAWPLPNVWHLVSVEDQDAANARIPDLLNTPSAVRGVSIEPLLASVDLTKLLAQKSRYSRLAETSFDALRGEGTYPSTVTGVPIKIEGPCLDWVIVGGESGPGARPMHPAWARKIVYDCTAAGVPVFFKQWGHFAPIAYGALHQFFVCTEGHYGPLTTGYVGKHRNGPDGCSAPTQAMYGVGKKAAGRKLDGKQYSEYPEVRA